MKGSIIKVFVFSIFLVSLMFAFNIFLDAQLKQLKYEDASVWNEISKGGIDADVVIIGSSRAATHIDPMLITKSSSKTCYNLGMMGYDFYFSNARFNYYCQFNKLPKLLIVSLNYDYLQRRADLFNHTQFLSYLDDSIIENATKQYEGFSKYDYRIPLLKYVGEQTLILSLIRNFFKPELNRPDRIMGFFARDYKWSSEVEKNLDTLKPYKVMPDSLSIAAFESFLDYTKAKEIQVVFVHTPTHPLGQEKVINRNEIINLYHKYALQYQIPFLDYAADTMCSNKVYFMNATHLNKFGAKVFTRKLIVDLQQKNLLPLIDLTKK